MNPLDLRGPEFLAFYAAFAAVVLGATALVRRWLEAGEPPKNATRDPYQLAFLRGGADEALRVATVSLVDRGLLRANGATLLRQPGASETAARRPIERALLAHFAEAREGISIFADAALREVCETYEPELVRNGLMPDETQTSVRMVLALISIASLVGLAGLKIQVALSRGRHDIAFLVLLTIAAVVAALLLTRGRRTRVGDRFLADMRELLSGLRGRASAIEPGGSTQELALLAAVYGIGVLPRGAAPYVSELFPRASRTSSSTSSCSSGCGSSSSCGSSCGGGGCGGGCGGCGGG